MKLEHIKSYYTINGLCLFIVCVILTFDLPLVRYRSRILQGRDPRSICLLIPDGRRPDQNIHDVTIVDMGKLPEPHIPILELAKLIHRWPPAVINHVTWRQREFELMRRVAKTEFRQKHLRPCTFCGAIIKTDMYRHVARRYLQLASCGDAPCRGALCGMAHLMI